MFRRLPAEWEKQRAVQLTWPHKNTDWGYIYDDVIDCYVRLADAISQREKLIIACQYEDEVLSHLSGKVNMSNVFLCNVPNNDTWARDHGPITVVVDGRLTLCDFCFNGWGLKFASNLDNMITRKMYASGIFDNYAKYENNLNFVLEGGSIESDGCGTILTTSECLLSPNRNEQFSREQVEHHIMEVFGANRVLWLDNGFLAGDDTDSHVDTLARLCSQNSIAYVKCDDEKDEHYLSLMLMERQLKEFKTADGQPYKLIPLPMADKVVVDGERLPATYANFLIMNGAVLVPTYGSSTDKVALDALQTAFPDREIVGVDCQVLIRQHGSLHCVTMQYPELG